MLNVAYGRLAENRDEEQLAELDAVCASDGNTEPVDRGAARRLALLDLAQVTGGHVG